MIKSVKLLVLALFLNNVLLAQEPLVKLPFELFGEHIIIKIRINNSQELDFIFDTGDGLTVLDIDKAAQLGLVAEGAVKKTSAGGKVTGVLLKHQKIEIEDQEITEVEIYETSLLTLERTIGRKFDGIIGYDILKNYTVRVDYDNMEFQLYDSKSKSFKPKGDPYPLNLSSYIPVIEAKFQLANGESYKGDFFVDSGARAAFDLNSPFVNDNGIIAKLGKNYQYAVMGIGGEEIAHYKGIAKSLSFGESQFTNVPLGLSQASQGIQSNKKVDGIFGNELLKKYNITYDYNGKSLYFEKNSLFDVPFQIDASGIDFQLDDKLDRILIHQVHPNTPAAAAGIEIDADLIEINGKNATGFTFPQLREILSKDGTSVLLKVIQSGEIQEITIALKSII
jgi:predicted aspartyl protease